MSDSVAGSFAMLAGVEIVNDSRTFAYLNNGLKPPSLDVRGDCGCEHILELTGCVTGYTTPAADNAPWFSPDIPESANFAGFIVDEFEGMSSTFVRSTNEAIFDGGILGRGRIAGRTLNWRGFLFGATCCSVAYGIRWLAKTLAAGSSCKDCSGDDLILMTCCPDASCSETSAFRTLKSVGLVEGPLILNERKTSERSTACPCGMSCIVEIEFTLYAAQPYFYDDEVPLYDCINLGVNGIDPATDTEQPCPDGDCTDEILDALCPPPVLPPVAVYVNPCEQNLAPYKAVYLTVPRSSWNFLEEVIPVISITTGVSSVADIQLGFYTSANNNPCGDLISFPPLCDVICDDLGIVGIPANSTFYIDGRTRKMSLICGPVSIFPGEPLTLGPWTWPSFSDFGFCLEVRFPDPVFSGLPVDDVCVSMSIVPRTF